MKRQMLSRHSSHLNTSFRKSGILAASGKLMFLCLLISLVFLASLPVLWAEENPKVTKKLPKADKYFENGDSAKAINLLEDLIEDYDKDPRPAARLAQYYLESKLFNDAISFAQKAFDIDPSSDMAKKVLCDSNQGIGQMNIQFRKYDQAKEAYDKMYELCPTDENRGRMVYLYSKIVDNALQNKDLPTAINAFEEIMTLESDNQELYVKLTRLYLKNDQKDKAQELLKKAIGLFPTNQQIAQALAAFYFQEKNFEGAINLFTEVLTRDPNNLSIATLNAYAYQAIGQQKFEDLKVAGKLPKPTLTPGTSKKSIDAYNKEVEAKKLEMVQLKQEVFQPVIDAFNKAIAIDAKAENPKLILNLAVLYGFIGDENMMKAAYKKAALVYKGQIDLNPEDIDSLYYFGFCFSNAGTDYDDAINAFRKVTILDSEKSHPTALIYIGEIQVEQKKYEEARESFKEFIRTFPEHSAVNRAESWLDYIDAVLSGTPAGQKPQKMEITEPAIDLGEDNSEGLTLDEGVGGLEADSPTSVTP